jgi:hypothetical protein
MINSWRIIWAGHVICIGEMRNAYKILVGKPEGKSHLNNVDMDGRIMSKWILRKWGVGCGPDSFG